MDDIIMNLRASEPTANHVQSGTVGVANRRGFHLQLELEHLATPELRFFLSCEFVCHYLLAPAGLAIASE